MKEIREERFTKKEDVGFNPSPLSQTPPVERAAAPEFPAVQVNERSNVRLEEQPRGYTVIIPHERRKTRQSFDIFEDQYEALKKLQIAESDKTGEHGGKTLGVMVQEALDIFIQKKARELGNMHIARE